MSHAQALPSRLTLPTQSHPPTHPPHSSVSKVTRELRARGHPHSAPPRASTAQVCTLAACVPPPHRQQL
eukprot:6873671-Prymnesium_polylepis.1